MGKQRLRVEHAAAFVLGALLAGRALPVAAQDNVVARIDAVFEKWNAPGSPGCVYGVMRKGELVHAEAVGLADRERNIPLTPDSPFDLASMGKQFTAAGIALLVLEKKVSLDDDVRRFIPELPDYGSPITIDHLLHHQSGLRDYPALNFLRGSRGQERIDNVDVVALLVRQKALNFELGERFLYSNSNYVLLAEVIHRVTGETLPQFAQARLFAPLEMSATFIAEPTRARTRSYIPASGGFEAAVDGSRTYGDGHVLSTLRDLARWDANFYTGTVGGAALIELLRSRGRLPDRSPTDYGLGLQFGRYRGQPMELHGGSMAGFRTQLMRFPGQGVSIAVLCNDGGAVVDLLATQIADAYLGDVLAPRESAESAPAELAIDPLSFDAYVGDYRVPNGDSYYVLTVSRNGDRYFMQRPGIPPLELFASAPTEFFLKATPARVAFHRDGDGTASRVTIFQPSGNKEGTRVVRAAIRPAVLAEYAGHYESEELETSWQLEVDDARLVAIDAKGNRLPLDVRDEDRFALPGEGVVVFLRGPRRDIAGFRLSTARATGLAFERSTSIN